MGRRGVALIDDVWDRISPLLGRRLIVREALLAATIVLYLAINTARTALDHGIAKIHDNGVSGISTNSLHNGPKAITTAFATWRAGYARLRPLLGHHPVRLAEAQTALELLLVPLSFLVWYAIG